MKDWIIRLLTPERDPVEARPDSDTQSASSASDLSPLYAILDETVWPPACNVWIEDLLL
jgi:hypothetical protein